MSLIALSFSYAQAMSFTVNVPNNQGSYTAVVIQQSGSGYVGPQGEYYPQFPTVSQLQTMYGSGTPAPQSATIIISVAPPALPVYVQPDPPAPNYIWTPGYWAYDSFFEDYYWVPGTWVRAPSPGLLWTPGYWGWNNGQYVYNEGYWGVHIGFYGGINYGYGYGGHGFNGGNWQGNTYIVNRTTINITINNNSNTSSFNGGPGGVSAQPTAQERSFMHEKHVPPTSAQRTQMQTAHQNPSLRASFNHGRPSIAATARAGVFKGSGIVASKKAGAYYNKTKPFNAARTQQQTTHLHMIASPSHAQSSMSHAQYRSQAGPAYKSSHKPQNKTQHKPTLKRKPKPKPRPKPKPKPQPPAQPQSQQQPNG